MSTLGHCDILQLLSGCGDLARVCCACQRREWEEYINEEKIFSLALTLTMLLSLAVPAMAVSVKETVSPGYVSIDPFSEGLASLTKPVG